MVFCSLENSLVISTWGPMGSTREADQIQQNGLVYMAKVLSVHGILKTFVFSSCEIERASFAYVKNKDARG